MNYRTIINCTPYETLWNSKLEVSDPLPCRAGNLLGRLELERIKTIHRDMLNSGRGNDASLLDLSRQVQRIQRNIHEHLNPSVSRLIDDTSSIQSGKFIPLSGDAHWICTVPRHADLEQIIADLEARLDQQRRELTDLRHENRRLVKKAMKMDGLDLAAGHRRSRSTADLTDRDNLQVTSDKPNRPATNGTLRIQDDVYVLEQQLVRRQREVAVANEQLREMTSLSHSVSTHRGRFLPDRSNLHRQVVHDLKTARQRQSIAKRETKGLEQKINLLTRKLYSLTNETKQAEDAFDRASNNLQMMIKEQAKLDQVRRTDDRHRRRSPLFSYRSSMIAVRSPSFSTSSYTPRSTPSTPFCMHR